MRRLPASALRVVLVAAAAALPYARTLDVPFTFDDEPCIVRNPAVRRLAPDAAPGPVASLCAPPSRALGEWTLALNYRVGRLEPAGYHLFNLGVHVASALLVYALVSLALRALRRPEARGAEPSSGGEERSPEAPPGGVGRAGGRPGDERSPVPLFAALLFAVHPIQTQAVTYVVQRYASLATMLYLLAVVLYLTHRLSHAAVRRWLAYCGALGAIVAAMFTKEISFTAPLAMALCEAVLFRGPRLRRLAGLAPFLLALGIVPLTLLGAGAATAGPADVDAALRGMAPNAAMTRWEYLVTQVRVLVSYLRLLALPLGQNIDHDVPLHRSLMDPPVLASLALLAGILGLAVAALGRSSRGDEPSRPELRLAAWGAFWFFLTLSVESSFVPLPDLLVEYRLYLPSVGFFVAVAAAAALVRDRLAARRNRAAALVAPALSAAVLALAAATLARNELWRDEVALWEDAAHQSPAKARVRLELGRLYLEAGRMADSERALRAAILLDPRDPAAPSALGAVLKRQGRFDEALASYRQALALGPGHADVHYNLGLLLASAGRFGEAIAAFEEAARLRPDVADIHNALGVTLAQAGRLDDAVAELLAAIRIDPNHTGARRNLARAEAVRGRASGE
jgi:Flp pilus assembly protein TadD